MQDGSKSFDLSPKTAAVAAIILAVVHLVLALWFSSITPYRSPGRILSSGGMQVSDIGAPDERQHANYIINLMDGKGFPVFDPHDPHLGEDYQSHQPPLYYLVAAAWAKVTGASDLTDEGAGERVRALNAVIGAGSVFMTFLLGYWGFRRAGVGLCAAALVALLPMNVALDGAITNDPLLILLCTAALAVCARCVWDGWTVKRCVVVGVLAGLAMLTKTTALGLLPAIGIAVLLSDGEKPRVKEWVAAIVPMILLPLGWWIRNQSLYGDPFAIKAFNQAFVGSPQADKFIQGLGISDYFINWVGWWTLRSFFGAFGYMDIFLNETGLPAGHAQNTLYRLLMAGSFVVFLGWLSTLKKGEERKERVVQIMNVTFFLVILLLFLKFNLQYFQAQARYILPAISSIACGYAVGTMALTKNRWQIALAILVVVFGGTTVYAGLRLPGEFEKRETPRFGLSDQHFPRKLAGQHLGILTPHAHQVVVNPVLHDSPA